MTTTAVLMFAMVIAAEPDRAVDLVLLGGNVVTLNNQRPAAEALAVRGDRIVAVGSNADIKSLAGAKTRVIQLSGQLVIPGFIEGHAHFVGLGEAKMKLDLTRAKTWDEIVAQVAAAARTAPQGQWIVGRGWHQDKWIERPAGHVGGYPTHESLSRAVPNHPVLLAHAAGHMIMTNARAMQLAGIDRQTPNPAGGTILKDDRGEPTGAFNENAMEPIYRAHERDQQRRSAEQIRQDRLTAIKLAGEECLAHGVTSFQDAGSSFATIDVLKQLAERGELPVRLWVMTNEGNDALARRMADYRMIGVGNHYLTVRGIKRFMDGALGTHGAWLLEPYDDMPGNEGLNLTSPATIRRTAELAVEHGYQLCVHAIGDRANRETLDVFAGVFNAQPETNDLRWRIEHAQHLDPQDIPRFKQLGVIASMQAIHCTSDAPFVVQRLGQRRAKHGAYVWQSLLESGAIVINGSDAPVEPISPIDCFYASVTRKLPDGVAFYAEQCMTREQALRSYTTAAAFAAFEEDLKGTLTPGKLADIVVLSKDIMTVPESEIRNAAVLYTIVGGRVKFERRAPARSE
jgi:predicted amidohydrolase YtcJ